MSNLMSEDKSFSRFTVNDDIKLGLKVGQIVEYYFANPEKTQKAIAAEFGISEQRVSQILRSKRVLAAYPILARRKIKSYIPKAAKAYGELIDQKANLEVRRKAAERVLDSEKVLEPQEIKITGSIEQKPTDELMRILEQSKQINAPIIDTTVVDNNDVP